jgi:uridine kinase
LNRCDTPKDEKGNYDFESINALDLKLFNENLQDLMNGQEINLPRFNFKKGEREYSKEVIKLPEKGIIIIEGIHGLNEKLTATISRDRKFKIYISALTQLNLDDHNRIATTDVRLIRRIVRDYLSRGYGGEETLRMWESVRSGEEKNIFIFQEEANAMFNSTLAYELCVLKKYAILELNKIKKDSPVYSESLRLKSFLNFFEEVDAQYVPENSILREFIGGSCFYRY